MASDSLARIFDFRFSDLVHLPPRETAHTLPRLLSRYYLLEATFSRQPSRNTIVSRLYFLATNFSSLISREYLLTATILPPPLPISGRFSSPASPRSLPRASLGINATSAAAISGWVSRTQPGRPHTSLLLCGLSIVWVTWIVDKVKEIAYTGPLPSEDEA